MLKSIAKLRNRKKRKVKNSDKNANDVTDGSLTVDYGGLGGSRNSSKSSLTPSDDGNLNGDVMPGEIPQFLDEVEDSEDDVIKATKPDDIIIEAENLYDVFTAKHADEDRLFRAEFTSIPAFVTSQKPMCDYAKRPEHKDKNRYKNVITCDHSRVELSKIDDVEGSDYINASYIDGYNRPDKFIAAQGPKENTLNDFWRMIWEKHCYVIVMITELREVGRKKCEQYWPEDCSVEYGKVVVQLESIFEYGSFTKRLLKVTHTDFKDELPRKVTQFHYRAWPDHGVPKVTSEIFRFRLRTLEAQPDDITAGPIVVHCSAGVGRTGTYIALDVLLGRLIDEGTIDVYSLIVEMRMRRTEMVQSLDQYVLLHKLVTEFHLFGDSDVKSSDFEEKYKELEKTDDKSGESGFDSQFDRLSKSWPRAGRFGAGGIPANKDKNRDEDVIPFEHCKVFVRMRPSEQTPVYCNASTLQAYDVNTNLIASQAPLESTVEDFLRVIIDNYVTCVVMMTPLKKGDVEHCFQYWPEDAVGTDEDDVAFIDADSSDSNEKLRKNSVKFGEITVHNDSCISHKYFDEVKLRIVNDNTEHIITQVRYLEWEDEDSPPPDGGAALLEIASFVAKQLNTLVGTMQPRVLVHCSDGAGRTGVLCSIVNLLERLKREKRIDVFRSVKDLRDCRPLMVRSKEQYKFCYDIIRHHLSTSRLDQT